MAGANQGYVYFDGSSFGLLNAAGSWRVRVDGSNTELYGGVYMPTAYIAYIYDRDNTAYYIDPNGSSYTNYFGRNYGFNWTEYDWNNTAYYVDPNNTSIYNDLRANIFYDYGNTGYYMDPNSNSRLANVQTDAVLLNWPGYNGVAEATGHYIWPGSYDRAWQQSWYIRSGPDWGLWSNTSFDAAGGLYSAEAAVLVRDRWIGSNYYGSNGDMYLTWKGTWLSTDLSNLWSTFGSFYQVNTWQWNHYFGSDGATYGTIFYDTNNSGYYVDPASTSRINYGVFDNVYSYGWMQAGAFYYTSDKRLKENIRDLEHPVDIVKRLRGVRFDWKKDHRPDVGFIAQEVEEILPELVRTDGEGMKSVEYGNMTAVLTAAVQKQQEQIDRQNARIEELEKRLADLAATPGR